MSGSIQALREQRALAAVAVRTLVDSNTGDKWNSDCQAKYDTAIADIDRLDGEIKRIQKTLDIEAAGAASIGRRADRENIGLGAAQDAAEREMGTFLAWVRGGMTGLNDEQRVIAQRQLTQIQAAQSTSGTAGGYTVPQDFMDMIETALKEFGGMREAATILSTESGADLPFPTVNDTAQSGAILSENSQITGQDVAFGQVTIQSYMYTSKLILVSLQLLRDSAFDIAGYLAGIIADRIGRAQNAHFTTGNGSTQPNGIVTAAASGKVGTTGQTATVIYDDLVDLFHAVDPAYRRKARWMMNDASLKVMRKLKDTTGAPIFIPGFETRGIAGAFEDTLLGKPVITNQDMATMSASAKSILFGDFSKYYIRDVKGVQMLQLRERYADYLQVGFFGFQATDGDLIDAGTNPVKYYQNSAT